MKSVALMMAVSASYYLGASDGNVLTSSRACRIFLAFACMKLR
ncbi:hypothetical protein [Burkholderia cepacia]|nr:hypothetical protein [Burkholderia cepacia]